MADGRFGATFYQSIGPDVFTEIVSPLAYNDGTWHHAAAVLRNGLVELYVDGTLKAADTTSPILSVRPSTGVQIGRVASNFAGDIDEVFVFSRALTAAEIAARASGSTSSVLFADAKLPSEPSQALTQLPGNPTTGSALKVVTSRIDLCETHTSAVEASGSVYRRTVVSPNVAAPHKVSLRTGEEGPHGQSDAAFLFRARQTATSVPIRFST